MCLSAQRWLTVIFFGALIFGYRRFLADAEAACFNCASLIYILNHLIVSLGAMVRLISCNLGVTSLKYGNNLFAYWDKAACI